MPLSKHSTFAADPEEPRTTFTGLHHGMLLKRHYPVKPFLSSSFHSSCHLLWVLLFPL